MRLSMGAWRGIRRSRIRNSTESENFEEWEMFIVRLSAVRANAFFFHLFPKISGIQSAVIEGMRDRYLHYVLVPHRKYHN